MVMWLQENWVVAVVGLVVAVVLLWFLFGRTRAEPTETPVAPPAEPRKPLEPVKPDIVAAEPARFKPVEPAPASIAKAPPPRAPEPVAATPPPPPAPEPDIAPEPVAGAASPEPAPPPPAEPAPPPVAKIDNLQLIKGVGPKMMALLNGLGVTSFQQIADWTEADIAAIDPQLGAFQGRITRDNIVDQAGYLARGDKAGFEAKYGALGGEL